MNLPGKWESLLSWVSYLRDIWIFGHHGYLDIMGIWTSRIFRHHGYLDIMDIWTSRIFRHHGYLDIMDIQTSWIFGHHGYSDIMDIRTLWLFRHHEYSDIMDIQMSWIFGCLDIVDILGDSIFSGKIVFLEKGTFEALSMQSCIVKLYIWNIGAAGSRRTFPHFYFDAHKMETEKAGGLEKENLTLRRYHKHALKLPKWIPWMNTIFCSGSSTKPR